jgi:hypothetical protein
MSVGMGAAFVTLTLLATTNVEESDAGLASGIFNTSQQVGGALGLAVLAALAARRTEALRADGVGAAAATVAGFHLAWGVAALIVLAAFGIAAVALTPTARRAGASGRAATTTRAQTAR